MSIRQRLAAWYAGSVLALFLLTGLLLRLSLHTMLEREHQAGVERSAEVAHNLFRTELREFRTTANTVAHMTSELVIPDQVLEFVRPDGAVFVSAPPPLQPGAAALAPPVYTVEHTLDAELAPGWVVRVHASMAPLQQSLERIDHSLLLVIPVTVLLAAATGWWLTGRTLRPVGEMAAAAERITPATPHARIPIADPRDELGRLATRFNDLLERLALALTQQRRFLAEAAHELRTPVARMLSQTERALSAAADDDERRRSLLLIRTDLERTRSLVGELLQLARVDAGEPAPPLADGFLDDVVAAAIQPWYAAAERGGVRLEIDELEEAPARLNAELMARALGVLVDNAIRYTPAGGRVVVRVARQEEGSVLEVRDTGVGISAEERERLFERFYRGPRARERAPEGSGLGLPIAALIVRQHAGHIQVTDAPGGGTLVRVVIPAPGPPAVVQPR